MDEICLSTPPFEILAPATQSLPLVVASPHSGQAYPRDFLEASRLDALALRKSEDCFVHEIFAGAPELGAPLIHALFPRAYVDPNREPYELDPVMFEDELPDYVNRASPRVAVGLGTIARVVADGEDIYRRKLRFAEAERPHRMALSPLPRRAFERLIEANGRQRFGGCLLLDAHSMPSTSGASGDLAPRPAGRYRAGRPARHLLPSARHPRRRGQAEGAGLSCRPQRALCRRFHHPAHYGKPERGRHCLQVEINRALYMDERSLAPKPYLAETAQGRYMAALVATLGQLDPATLAAALNWTAAGRGRG